jgi:outer membrane receptor protein involved in Fe transport|tara:strand:- start:747 stop:2891 length:2145 start_codon:yes stop_codon:yes gene_type:complete
MDKTILGHLVFLTVLFCTFFSSLAFTEELEKKVDNKDIESIVVLGVRQRLYKAGELKNTISKTELLSSQQLKDKQASSLTDALQAALGVRVSNECSMCGAKRVMINGLKGEHTNVLVDGIPIHTMLSGFYGLDAVAMAGVGTIEIARGAGASLISPEAIGGTINLVSKIPSKNHIEIDVSTGEGGYQKAAVMLTGVNQSGSSQGSLVVQKDIRDQFDGDSNGVSETPFLDNQSFTFTGSHDFSYSTNLRTRLNHTKSEVFGGPVLGDTADDIRSALDSFAEGESNNLFVGGDVNGRYIGKPWETAEWVSTKRNEILINLLHDFESKLNVTLSIANISHVQDSFYEGIDYYADDVMRYLDARFNYELSNQHFLTFGTDSRRERMRSKSNALINNPDYMSDSFDYNVLGFYIQDSWTPNDKFDMELALRFDQIQADFIDSDEIGKEIDRTLISPRVDMRYRHDDDWQSRLSFGKGYRAPLSFFESDHGILDAEKGYSVQVTEPERSSGINYSLNYAANKVISTFSFAHTAVDNLATLSQTTEDVPVLTQLTDKAKVMAIDWTLNYQWTERFNIGISAEIFDYNAVFKESFAIAPTEKRATLSGLWDNQKWRISLATTWVASRNLSDYGYKGFDKKNGSGNKPAMASSFFNVDTKIAYQLSSNVELYFGALNLFDYNQADDESSPLLFDESGGYDVTYIFAPMRGRTAYIGFNLDFG